MLAFDDPFNVPGAPYPPFPYVPVVSVVQVFGMVVLGLFLFCTCAAVTVIALSKHFRVGLYAPGRVDHFHRHQLEREQAQAVQPGWDELPPPLALTRESLITATVTDLPRPAPTAAPRAVTSRAPERISGPTRKEIGR